MWHSVRRDWPSPTAHNSESLRAATLLPCHRDREPVLGLDVVIVSVVPDVDLHHGEVLHPEGHDEKRDGTQTCDEAGHDARYRVRQRSSFCA
jgi:hypothetical protein